MAIAGQFATVTGVQWQRTGARSDGARFTVETFARYFIHDPVHHLYDVTGAAPYRLTLPSRCSSRRTGRRGELASSVLALNRSSRPPGLPVGLECR